MLKKNNAFLKQLSILSYIILIFHTYADTKITFHKYRNPLDSINFIQNNYNALILPIATYASETWTLKSEDTRKLTVFEMRCLRSILGTTIADRIRNTDIITRSGIRHTIIDHIKTRRLSWFGHVVRRPEDSYVYKAYKDDSTQARPRG